jgi:ribonuclease J
MVFVTHYSRDVDRFRSIYTAAKQNSRSFVISTRTAHLLNKLIQDTHLDLPDPTKDEYLKVYYKQKKSGQYAEKDYYTWERLYLDKMVTCEDVHSHQNEFVMDLNFYQFAELIDIKPDAQSHFIHSMSEPFSEEDIEDEVMHNWLRHFDINFHQLHASGHMNRKQLEERINRVNPKKLFPIHTENPRLFKEKCCNVQEIELEKQYVL